MAKNLAESAMYDWRVKALLNWIDANRDEATNSISMEKLSKAGHLDQYHYLGLEANEDVIRILGLKSGMHILDVGCGIGGPARYLGWKSGAHITGIDIQPDLVKCGNEVCEMVGLADCVQLICGDVSQTEEFESKFDAFVSLLVILHIADRASLFAALFRSIKPGGGFLIEDMVALNPEFSAEEDRIAKTVIGAPNLPTIQEYAKQLQEAGWVDVEFETLTPEWTKWCVERSDQYVASAETQIKLHGLEIFNQRSAFYADVKNLFKSGKLGGVRITGRKPSEIEAAFTQHRKTKHKESIRGNGNIIETN